MPPSTQPGSPVSFRIPPIHRSTSSMSRTTSSQTLTSRIKRTAYGLQRKGVRLFFSLTPLQRAGVVAIALTSLTTGILSIVYHDAIFHWLTNFAKGWRNIPAGWILLWIITFVVSFPPLIGYSTCVTLAGFVFGFPHGWFIVASASTLGATAAFAASRSFFSAYAARLAASDTRFAALSLVLKHDGIKLLCMIRIAPLPFSLTNGALSTIPTISWWQFLFATGVVSPKLLLHVWIGHQMAELAEKGDKMDAKTKALSYVGIVFGAVVGMVTAWLIYSQTLKRMREVEELEGGEQGGLTGLEYLDEDDPQLAEDARFIREQDDDISLQDTWDDDYRDESSGAGSDLETRK